VSDNPSVPPAKLTIADRLKLGVQYHQAGRLADAEALYRSVLSEAPRNPDALALLGVLAYHTAQPAVAIDLIRQALAVSGPHPVYLSNLAAAFIAAGRMAEAEAHSREALRLRPTHPDAHYNLAVALLGQGRVDASEPAFRETLRLRPTHVDARFHLASILHRQGKLPEAVTLLSEAVRLAPDHVGVRNALGAALLALSQPAAAEPHFREALRLAPSFAEAHSNLGLALREQDRIDEAVHCFRESLRLKPGYVGAYNNLAFLLQSQGRSDEARAGFHEALRLDPNNTRAFAGLSRLAAAGHYEFSDDEVRRIEAILSQGGPPTDERSRLHFALARVAEKASEHDRAFGHYHRANELLKEYLRARGAAYNPAVQSRLVDQMIAAFTPAYFERVRSFGSESVQPVFVVGMPRSGTTLAEQIIASHPRARGAGELRDVGDMTITLPRRLGCAEAYPGCLGRLDAATVRALAAEYLDRLRQRDGAADRIVDKMPFNYLHLGLIATLFPRARVVHCRRDPIDTCLSCYFQHLVEPQAFTPDLTFLGHYYREYERLMAYWARALPLPMFELRYEELTADQEAVSRRLIEFCGLDWDERCLRFHETERTVLTPSALQVRQPLYRSSVGRWKRYEKHLGPLIEALKPG
jgi:tetratricopeptide (TPR) repeat protein